MSRAAAGHPPLPHTTEYRDRLGLRVFWHPGGVFTPPITFPPGPGTVGSFRRNCVCIALLASAGRRVRATAVGGLLVGRGGCSAERPGVRWVLCRKGLSGMVHFCGWFARGTKIDRGFPSNVRISGPSGSSLRCPKRHDSHCVAAPPSRAYPLGGAAADAPLPCQVSHCPAPQHPRPHSPCPCPHLRPSP